MTDTIVYAVRFKRDANSLPEQKEFNTPGPAYGFAYNIEVEGGVAIVSSGKRADPFTRTEPSTIHNIDELDGKL